ncbi:MAG: FUSC family protein, partial [Chloroflexota bacterium]
TVTARLPSRALPARRRAAGPAVRLGLVIVAPVAGTFVLGAPASAGAAMSGAILAVPAALRIGPDAGARATAIACGAGFVALLLPPFIPVIALWTAALGALAGLAAARGRQSVIAGAPVAVAYLLATAAARGAADPAADLLARVVPLAGIALGGLWVAAAAALLLRGRMPPGPVLLPEAVAVRYAAALAVALFAAGWLIGSSGDAHGYWLVTALVAVFQPDPAASRRRAAERVIGVLAGALAGGALVASGLPAGPLLLVAAVAAPVAVYTLLGGDGSGRAWLTLALVCAAGPGAIGVHVAEVRVVATLVAVGLAVAATALIPPVEVTVGPASAETPPAPARGRAPGRRRPPT